MALLPWQHVGGIAPAPSSAAGIARFAGIKQVNEIQMMPGSPPTAPIYLRRRITYASLMIELDYNNSILDDINDKIRVWLSGIWVPNMDFGATISWYEPGNATLFSLTALDNDGMGNAYSGCWITDGKEIQAVGEGSITVIVTFRNEGAWILDADR